MVYTPRQSNDRLLLGLKGSLNEDELDLLRQRSVEARREKARRGELIVAAPAGYVQGEDRLEKNPDRRVQERVLFGWKQFEEIQHTMTNNAHLGDRSGAAKRGSALWPVCCAFGV